ncbi:FadR/GntR family transcriptional regulator [Flavobacteriaceae bacterium LMO-SS05]
MKKLLEIAPLTNLSLVDKVELRLTEYIKKNRLKIGDSIPKEMEFAEALGVSRTVVREAFSRLRTIGIIESKKHKGMVLSQPDIMINLEKVFETNLLGDDTLKDIFELRLILEMGMIDLLFARKTEEDLIELEDIVNNMGLETKDTSIFSLDKEIAFHGKLYQMAGNSTLQRFQNLLLPVFQYVHAHKLSDADSYMYAKRFVTHRQLLDLLKKDDVESFRTAMRQHLEPHYNRVLQKTIF